MRRRFRRDRGSKISSRSSRLLRARKLRVEQLEPRVVLSLLMGGGSSSSALNSIPLIPSLSFASPSGVESSTTEQTTQQAATWDQPRQLPGSMLRQLPPADVYKIEPVIVAGDPNLTPTDSPADRVDPNTADSLFAGVGSLKIHTSSGDSICTATAISPFHVVTAAHCLDKNADGSIDATPENVKFNVNMSGSSSTYVLTASELYVHPDWTGFGHPSINDDVAVIELASLLPADVPIYALNDVPFDQPVTATMVGYGRSGTGVSGYTTGASYTVKRSGGNVIDYYFTDDEGSGARETFQFDFDFPNSPESLGNDIETTLGGGDSGGPSFIDDGNGGLKLFGLNTFTTQFAWNSPDAPYFGSGGGGMVVQAYLDFINSILFGSEVVITPTDGGTAVFEGERRTFTTWF